MPKRGKFERSGARHRRGDQIGFPGQQPIGAVPPQLPDEAVAPTSPEATADMAAGGMDVVRGNSSAQPLSPQGQQTVHHVGQQLAALGGPSQIVPSTSARAQQTGQALAQETGAPVGPPQPGLESHALGNLEGAPKSPEVQKLLADLVRKYPNYRIPGQGAMAGRGGESFNEYRVRALSAVRGLMQTLAENPLQSIAVPDHSQVINLVRAWAAKGCPDDLSIDSKVFLQPDTAKPGDVERFYPTENGRWVIRPFDMATAAGLPKGSIYFVRHGETASTPQSNAPVLQRHRAQIIAHVQSGQWGRARSEAQKAYNAGLPDHEISAAIDEGLPPAQSAYDLPAHHLLAAASAASRQKRQEYGPAIAARFSPGTMANLPPDASQAIREHLQRLS